VGYAPQVFTLGVDGSARRLTHGKGGHGSPVWSPGGRRLATGAAGNVEVLGARDGRLLRRFEGWPGGSSPAAWSPDGRRLAFIAYHPSDSGYNGRLMVVSVRDRANRDVAHHAGGPVDWSPDGRSLLYLHGNEPAANQPRRRREIYVLPSGGGTPRKLVSNVFEFGGLSPDGRWLLFTRLGGRDQSPDLWIARSDGSDERLLGRNLSPFRYGWAPGGRGVFVLRYGPEDRRHPLLISKSGERRKLGARIATSTFAWSPDGKRLAWATRSTAEVRSSRPDGTDVRVLGRFASRDFAEVATLAWSANSRRLAAVVHRHEGD
jgi:Tol biopolymer transport system component